jgi:hypothetical protein
VDPRVALAFVAHGGKPPLDIDGLLVLFSQGRKRVRLSACTTVEITTPIDTISVDDHGAVRGIVLDAAEVIRLRQPETLFCEDGTKYSIEPLH